MRAYQRKLRKFFGKDQPKARHVVIQSASATPSSLPVSPPPDSVPFQSEVVPVQSNSSELLTEIFENDMTSQVEKLLQVWGKTERELELIDGEANQLRVEATGLEEDFSELHFKVAERAVSNDLDTDSNEEKLEHFDQNDNFSRVRIELYRTISVLINLELNRKSMLDKYADHVEKIEELGKNLPQNKRNKLTLLLRTNLKRFTSVKNITISDGDLDDSEDEEFSFDSFLGSFGNDENPGIPKNDSIFLLDQ
jgi:hypothetical protein